MRRLTIAVTLKYRNVLLSDLNTQSILETYSRSGVQVKIFISNVFRSAGLLNWKYMKN